MKTYSFVIRRRDTIRSTDELIFCLSFEKRNKLQACNISVERRLREGDAGGQKDCYSPKLLFSVGSELEIYHATLLKFTLNLPGLRFQGLNWDTW